MLERELELENLTQGTEEYQKVFNLYESKIQKVKLEAN